MVIEKVSERERERERERWVCLGMIDEKWARVKVVFKGDVCSGKKQSGGWIGFQIR